jgi:hypothetical protein
LRAAIIAARMATQTLRIPDAAGVQKMTVEVEKHHYSVDLIFSKGIITMSVHKAARIESDETGKSWIIEKYEKALVAMNSSALSIYELEHKERKSVAATKATVDADHSIAAAGVQEMTELVEEIDYSLDLAFYPEVLSGGPNHVNTMLMF